MLSEVLGEIDVGSERATTVCCALLSDRQPFCCDSFHSARESTAEVEMPLQKYSNPKVVPDDLSFLALAICRPVRWLGPWRLRRFSCCASTLTRSGLPSSPPPKRPSSPHRKRDVHFVRIEDAKGRSLR
jgi:hypothetical protein